MTGSGLRAASGVAAAGVGLGVAEVVVAATGPSTGPLPVLGAAVVDQTPDAVREWVIQTFGTSDKLVLFVLMGVVALALAALAGLLERTARPSGSALFAALGLGGAVAAVNRPDATWIWASPSVAGAAAGILALRWMIRRGVPRRSENGDPSISPDRRDALRGIVGVAILAAAAGAAGRVLGARAHGVAHERAAVTLPSAPAPPIDPAADRRIPNLTPYLTPNADFYRIDTALVVPQVSVEDWSLRIHGMVEREITLSYADLRKRSAVERLVTLACVSNPIGGDLIGNARWLGYRLDELLAEAKPHPDADMVLSRSTDGWTAGSPLAALTDGRDALLAVGMNGEPLPVRHGYPARLVVPGLYGYVSATKWVTELEITRFDRAQAYWTTRGWSALGPIKTGTRIDTPRAGARVPSGRVIVAGVAWAQHRGIRAVEVQIDDGPWQPARMAAEPSIDSWRQWSFDWDAAPGKHMLRARSIDGTGEVQTSEVRDVIPDGATGYPVVSMSTT